MAVRLRLYTARARLVLLAAALAMAVAGFMALGGSSAHAAKVGCGAKITKDTTLHKDLVNCPNNGILIGADNVTLDLNGHTIDGNGTHDRTCDPVIHFCDFGVAFALHHGITVKHGSIRAFEGGVLPFRTSRVRLLGLSTSRNHFFGIAVANSFRILIKNSSGDRSTSHEGEGLGLFDSHRIRVLNSSFRHNVHVGIKPVRSTKGVIKGNLMARNGDEGFLMEEGDGFQIRRNLVARNGGGITLGPGSHNVITGNRVSHGRDGIRIEKGHGNLVAHNVVAHTRRAGIRLGIKHPFLGGSHNVVRRNLVRDSGADGFAVVRKARNSLLKDNVARGAGDDGFDIESRSMKLTGNRAVRNSDLGIEAVHGVNDGGGNVARHNGDPRQCTNIACN
jgi:parallel beta-helix repeat protein